MITSNVFCGMVLTLDKCPIVISYHSVKGSQFCENDATVSITKGGIEFKVCEMHAASFARFWKD